MARRRHRRSAQAQFAVEARARARLQQKQGATAREVQETLDRTRGVERECELLRQQFRKARREEKAKRRELLEQHERRAAQELTRVQQELYAVSEYREAEHRREVATLKESLRVALLQLKEFEDAVREEGSQLLGELSD